MMTWEKNSYQITFGFGYGASAFSVSVVYTAPRRVLFHNKLKQPTAAAEKEDTAAMLFVFYL